MFSQATLPGSRAILLVLCVVAMAPAFAISSSFRQESATRPRTTNPTAQSGATPAAKPAKAPQKPGVSKTSVPELIEQGKVHYRAKRFPQALAKFEAALRIDPNHDEALGLGAVTAFRLDSQDQAQQWSLRRAELPDQKPSVKAFSYYRVALSYWRRLHDPVAKAYTIKDGRTQFKLPDADLVSVRENLQEGMKYADRALQVNANYAEAHNIKNLLYSEAALATAHEAESRKNRNLAIESLRKAITLQLQIADRTETETANFNLPTVRICEVPRVSEEEGGFIDEMRKQLEGVLPVKRVSPIFPSARLARTKSESKDASSSGATDKGGAYSIGSGRGALTAAYAPGTVKVEVLISTAGDVVFAHIVDGRADLNGAAIVAARAWKFTPARFEGTPVQVSAVISLDLKLPGSKAAPTPTPKTSPR